MARAPKAAAPQEKVLPVPPPVLRHHEATLHPNMKQWLERSHVPPVLLITGPSGVGKKAVIYHLAQWLLCDRTGFSKINEAEESSGGDLFGGMAMGEAPAEQTREESLQPCGVCANCQRALSGNWLDFTEVCSDQNDDHSQVIKIDQLRKLKASLGFSAFEGAFRITLIRDADRMTPQAANSVLKILEEPPPGWMFFLTATDPSLLLPTIVSRCQTLRLRPFSTASLREILATGDVPADRQAICAALAQGSWSKAAEMGADSFWERRNSVFDFLDRPQAGLNALVDWASQEPENISHLADVLEQITGDLIQWSLAPNNDSWLNADKKKTLLAHAEKTRRTAGSIEQARELWVERALRLFRAREEIRAPLNRKLLVQDLLLPWLS